MKELFKQIIFSFLRKNMKLGVSYNLFDGEELLEASIKSIRNNVQYISVVYQKISNYGNAAEPDLEEKLTKLKKEGLIDEIYLYEPDLKLSPHQNEKNKRDIGLKLAKKNKCNYFMSMDVDEFYDELQFRNAIYQIIKNNVSMSAASIVEYLKDPENQIVGGYTFVAQNSDLYNFYVPFIIKINKFKKQKHGQGYFPCLTDPTRKLFSPGNFKLFSAQEIVLHHMSTVRKDLNKKYDNSSLIDTDKETQEYIRAIQQEILNFDFVKNKELPQDCSIFRKNLVKKVPNKFGIKL